MSGLGEQLLGGWQLNSIITLATGSPVTITTTFNRAQNQDARAPDRPDLRSGFSNNPSEGTSAGCVAEGGPAAGTQVGTPDRWFDPCAFELPTAGCYGDLGRTSVRGPGFAQVDFSVFKNFEVRENLRVQFRAELFNLFNRANFGIPAAGIFNSDESVRGNAGRITSTVATSRHIQLALRITF